MVAVLATIFLREKSTWLMLDELGEIPLELQSK
jgi:transcriptional regulator with GAF, ATPase, and Fis domain